MNRRLANINYLDKAMENIPVGERLRFFYGVIMALAGQVGTKRFGMAVRWAKMKHGG